MEKKEALSYGTYITIWFALVVLTGATVTAAGLHFGKLTVLAAIMIAGIKSSLVLFYFMHLKYEDRVFKIMLTVAVMTMVVILLLTYADTLFR